MYIAGRGRICRAVAATSANPSLMRRVNVRWFLRLGVHHPSKRMVPKKVFNALAGPKPCAIRPRIISLDAKKHKRVRYYQKVVLDVETPTQQDRTARLQDIVRNRADPQFYAEGTGRWWLSGPGRQATSRSARRLAGRLAGGLER